MALLAGFVLATGMFVGLILPALAVLGGVSWLLAMLWRGLRHAGEADPVVTAARIGFGGLGLIALIPVARGLIWFFGILSEEVGRVT